MDQNNPAHRTYDFDLILNSGYSFAFKVTETLWILVGVDYGMTNLSHVLVVFGQ